jgi:hypothetical protein
VDNEGQIQGRQQREQKSVDSERDGTRVALSPWAATAQASADQGLQSQEFQLGSAFQREVQADLSLWM